MKRKGYEKDLPKRLYAFFIGYDDGASAPSFTKFARREGRTTEQLESFRREHREFDRAWRECSEIRRDYLIDRALTKRYDPSFVKFLLTEDSGDDAGGDDAISVEVSVID